MPIDDKIRAKGNGVSGISNLVKIRPKSTQILAKIAGLSFLTAINCYDPKYTGNIHESETVLFESEKQATRTAQEVS